MIRRLAILAAALLLAGCDVPLLGNSAPQYGFITLTDDGEALVSGASDVPPTLDLLMQAQAPLTVDNVNAMLDGKVLQMLPAGNNLSAKTAPMPLGSQHHLVITIQGRAQGIDLSFNVISATQAMLAAHIDPSAGLVVDGVFDDAPDRHAIAAYFPGATITWRDPLHLRATWPGPPPATLQVPAGIPTARGSHLVAPIALDLTNIPSGTVRRVTVPAAPAVKVPNVVAFVVDQAPSNTSLAQHLGAVSWIVATGWQAQADGSILGTPDESAVSRAGSAGVAVWPSLANDPGNPAATTALLGNRGAESQLITTVVQSAVYGGFPGVNVDFEGMAATDKAPFTAFIKSLAAALHAKGVKLMVDVVPHDASGVNAFSAAYDVPALGAAADLVDLMAYDEHGNGGTPGPVAGLDWDTSVLANSLPGLSPGRTLLGIPLYARRWGTITGGASYGDALSDALAVPGARVGYDFDAQTPAVFAPDNSLITYFDDADSLARKMALVQQDGLYGIAAWRLGYEDPAFWSVLK